MLADESIIDRDVCAELVAFIIENHRDIQEEPISGHIRDLFAVFYDAHGIVGTYKYDQFYNLLTYISDLAPGCLTFENDIIKGQTITDINTYILKLLYKQIGKNSQNFTTISHISSKNSTNVRESDDIDGSTIVNEDISYMEKNGDDDLENLSYGNDPNDPKDDLSRLYSLINFEAAEKTLTYENAQLPRYLMKRLNEILDTVPMSFQLGKERARLTETVIPYIPVCQSPEHSMILAQVAYISNNKITSLQWSKLPTLEKDSPELIQCLKSHMHYVPNIKPQTDLSLGDCSYLDTCHKLNSCRYLHYLQYVPESLITQVIKDTERINETQSRHIPLYTHGSCSSVAVKEILPPQWIRCDVRKFDFSILGKFSVVVADPAWNIHMNLPYGTCNDIELLELPLDELQDEGVLFLWVTGRAIELGKESLAKWGYKVINEISWIKTNQLGRTIVTGRTGHWLNHSKEHLLVGMKGNPQWINKHIDMDIIVSTTRETSRKPDELYGMIERMVGKHARKLEIFGRDHNIRAGWFTIGNQLTGSCIYEPDIKAKFESSTQFKNSNNQQNNQNYSRNTDNHSNGKNNNNHYTNNNHRTNSSSNNNSKRGKSDFKRSNNNYSGNKQSSSNRVKHDNRGVNT
ncbi:similar to Saccharomyces cerevisiae YGL192W IME4 Probable mRNA N6-adenosine methyltransferase required for entry into meiosis [Maudiozyma saulgeensis]|uniref:mRNA m(6)A methyltransferase n=1 Tax=Maudiozyma saulgeensis TaxID=1789683 RepID=A0A1X7QZ54_9SACH|nr:similar to Saccharomyces cerevisiae YGL192W IME4 Probable mRNA N6-adenosine methyltransferase required for entry into meiosis [Kazachstania saulgeensis]